MAPRHPFSLLLILSFCLSASACSLLQSEPEPVATPTEMPAPDAVPAGTITAEVLESIPGTQTAPARRTPRRTVLATTRPAAGPSPRLQDTSLLTGPEIGRLMIGAYYRHTGGRVLHLRPNGQVLLAREGGTPDTGEWQITGDDRLCFTQRSIRTCQQVFRIGNDLLLAHDDGNQRRYSPLESRPDWL
ncbi:MAG: hypothetical protein AAGC83_01940 [Pseudomonadota bacterium]